MAHRVISNEIVFQDVKRLIDEGCSVKLAVKGNSMRPFIFHGNRVELRPIAKSIAIGDIVLAQNLPETYIIHRIIAIEDEFITLRGDGNLDQVETVLRKNIIAIVTSAERHNGQVIDLCTPAQRRYAQIWNLLLPIRRYLLFAGRHIFRWN